VSHPTLGRYFDAHLTARRCAGAGAGDLNESAGLGTLWRCVGEWGDGGGSSWGGEGRRAGSAVSLGRGVATGGWVLCPQCPQTKKANVMHPTYTQVRLHAAAHCVLDLLASRDPDRQGLPHPPQARGGLVQGQGGGGS